MTDEKKPQAPAVKNPPREIITVHSDAPLMDTAKFEHFQRVAYALANSSLLPESVRGRNRDECFSNMLLVIDMAERWNVNPMSLAQCISIIHGKMTLEGKLIAAMIDKHLGIRLRYEWIGKHTDGDAFGIVVSGKDPETGEIQSIDGTVGDWKTFEKDQKAVKANWRGLAARNQLAYKGAREWCRLYYPALMLGIYSDDEMDERRGPLAPAPERPQKLETGFAAAPESKDPEPEQPDPEIPDAEFTEGEGDQEPESGEAAPEKAAQEAQEAGSAPEAAETPSEPEKPAHGPENGDSVEDGEDPGAEAAEPESPEYTQSMQQIAQELQELDKFPALLEYCANLGGLNTWPSIKKNLTEVTRTADWAAAAAKPGQFALGIVRARTYQRSAQLKKPPKVSEDVTLFRCYIEAETDAATLRATFEEFCTGEIFGGLDDAKRNMLKAAVQRRIEAMA